MPNLGGSNTCQGYLPSTSMPKENHAHDVTFGKSREYLAGDAKTVRGSLKRRLVNLVRSQAASGILSGVPTLYALLPTLESDFFPAGRATIMQHPGCDQMSATPLHAHACGRAMAGNAWSVQAVGLEMFRNLVVRVFFFAFFHAMPAEMCLKRSLPASRHVETGTHACTKAHTHEQVLHTETTTKGQKIGKLS